MWFSYEQENAGGNNEACIPVADLLFYSCADGKRRFFKQTSYCLQL
jgi:hypothetical protein